jgi:alkanesulfonate monooxygenase SsuD/methylene tetrahydromethanopterin reductase-like flavin-dependent oxidoreductase (luciferase family)
VRDLEMYPKPKRQPFALWLGGHNMATVERAARFATGWLPGWRPWPELEERIKTLKARAAELGRDPAEIEIAPQFSLTIAKTPEEAERRYMASGLVAHRKSLAYTGRDLSKQVVANLVGSPDLIREKVEGLKKIGVDHACALMIPADSMAEFEDQVEWFAKTVLS